jgi:hypothetical protein
MDFQDFDEKAFLSKKQQLTIDSMKIRFFTD